MQYNTMEWKEEVIERFDNHFDLNNISRGMRSLILDFVTQEKHLAEQSLVQRIRGDIDDLEVPNEYLHEGFYQCQQKILALPLLTPKPKGDE